MKTINLLLIVVLSLITLTSCDGKGSFLNASSAANEVLVVMEKNQWEGETGKALLDVLNSPVKGLPQREPNFRILHVTPDNFTSTFKMARNIVTPDISSIYSAPKLSSELDKYAYGQVILTVKAPDTTTFINFLNENSESIIDYIVNKELERQAQWLIKDSDATPSVIKQAFGINIYYPKGLSNIQEYPNFYWATNNAPRARRDIIIYQFPYTSETIFEKDSLIAKRNEVLGEYIKGDFNSKMSTAINDFGPQYRKLEYDGLFRAELRGLWEMTTDMMGGPFVMQAFVNEKTNMVIVVEALVFAPERDKRNLMRGMEASLYTISIPE
ncbi:MAG: DUF4837 family protein [Proteiniphilum sp.]|nr:DUF4837 family protein [Proteiniphilum sp.]